MTSKQTCKHRSHDGYICVLYVNHYGRHKSEHLKHEWTDDE